MKLIGQKSVHINCLQLVYLPWPFQWGKPTVNQREATPIVFAELVALVEDLSAATLQKILADTRFKSLQARSKWFNDAVVIIFTSAPVVAVAVVRGFYSFTKDIRNTEFYSLPCAIVSLLYSLTLSSKFSCKILRISNSKTLSIYYSKFKNRSRLLSHKYPMPTYVLCMGRLGISCL
ncbi:uncharacterized protein LOC110717071 isoform X2 [Chenopodium quinoa]|uniref:uncharacterized protein LOC110717071 isoform X2 n=1 Tax=Chenopodium quinoa TaxID=63459 RepID=UPI000B78FDA9|nr:uncharacterized protein LOC110717071 isoform X2 [Chenopodium quinoa]XP_021752554.1 uncharacterized protein LOC110717071 isoform X2 [Chenopodium quinoa]